MKRTSTIAAASVAALALALSGCGGSTGSSSSGGNTASGAPKDDSNCASADVFCIGLVTDIGTVDDKSFNQAAWNGVQQGGQATSAYIKYVETKDTKDFGSNIQLFTDKKYDVVVTVGFDIADATVTAAKANTSTKFIGIDQSQTATVSNLAGLVFPEDKAGYAAGYLAALMTKSNKIGQVLGTKIPPVQRYAEGYIAGAKAANPKATVATVYHPAGDNAFADPVWGANEAQQQLAQGVDVIFAAGGKTGNGALGQVAKAGAAGTSTFCIGVDTDQWDTVPEAHSCLITSAEKLITDGTVKLIQQAKDGSMKGGNVTGDTGLAGYHDFDSKIPTDVKDKVAKVVAGLQDGSVTTGVKIS